MFREKQSLGQKLVRDGVITEQQYNDAVALVKSRGEGQVGSIFLERGLISELKLLEYLTMNHGRPKLGELLVAMNVVKKEVIVAALKKQQETGEKLGMVLINEGYIDKATLVKYLTLQAKTLLTRMENAISGDKEFIKRNSYPYQFIDSMKGADNSAE